MTEDAHQYITAIRALLVDMGEVSVAVSGGIDSVTLALLASQTPNISVQMYHAVSPAVPAQATERVKQLARDYTWDLKILDAQELLMRIIYLILLTVVFIVKRIYITLYPIRLKA